MRPVLLALALCAAPALAQTAASDSVRLPVDRLGIEHPGIGAALDHAVGFGRSWLTDNEVLAPFGVAVTAPGVPNVIAVDDPALTSHDVLMVLVETLRQTAGRGLAGDASRPVTAVALAFDILTSVPGRPGKTDALCVIVEAPDVDGARAYVLPYVRESGTARFLQPYLRDESPLLIPR